jgi:hypothetical protein
MVPRFTKVTARCVVYIGDRAHDAQRQAIADIVYGRAGGNGPYAIFASTMRYARSPQIVPIEMHVDGKRSSFPVSGRQTLVRYESRANNTRG